MKKSLLIILASLALAGSVLAQRKSPPSFDDFRVTERFKGKSASVNLRSHPQARIFRTMLRDTAKLGANFAGHYAVNYWGCGTECIRIGIVDLKTGKAYLSPFYASVGIANRVDSRLLIVAPPEQIQETYGNDAPEYLRPRYYVWRNDRLVLIYPNSERCTEAETFWK